MLGLPCSTELSPLVPSPSLLHSPAWLPPEQGLEFMQAAGQRQPSLRASTASTSAHHSRQMGHQYPVSASFADFSGRGGPAGPQPAPSAQEHHHALHQSYAASPRVRATVISVIMSPSASVSVMWELS
jgi:hypothetical protein